VPPADPADDDNLDAIQQAIAETLPEGRPDARGCGRRATVHPPGVPLEPLADPDAAHPLRPGNGGRDENGDALLTTVDPAVIEVIRETRERIRQAGPALAMTIMYPPVVVEAIRREWIAGVKSVNAIAREYGLPRTTILAWSDRHCWGPRDDARLVVRSKVTAELIARAAASVAPIPGEDDAPRVMTNGEVAAADPEKVAQAMVDDYAAVVANVVQRMRDTSGVAVETGRKLLDEYRLTLDAVMLASKGDRTRSLKALTALAGTYKTIASALHTAYQLQRQSYGLDATDGDDRPPGAGPEALGGTYEDAVREAEERGIALDS
jgi:hypothetical protein